MGAHCAHSSAGQVLKPIWRDIAAVAVAAVAAVAEPIFIGIAPAATVAKLRSVHRSIMLDLPLLTFTCVAAKLWCGCKYSPLPPPLTVLPPAPLQRYRIS